LWAGTRNGKLWNRNFAWTFKKDGREKSEAGTCDRKRVRLGVGRGGREKTSRRKVGTHHRRRDLGLMGGGV